MCNSPGGGGKAGGWKIDGGAGSVSMWAATAAAAAAAAAAVVADDGLETGWCVGGGGGNWMPFRWWCGGANSPGAKWNCAELVVGNLLSPDCCKCWRVCATGLDWICGGFDVACNFGLRGPRSCWTASKTAQKYKNIIQKFVLIYLLSRRQNNGVLGRDFSI